LSYAPKPTWWPLFGVSHGRWTDGSSRILIGDAAHAMTPFAAQGAAMAIEDAYELAGVTTGNAALSDALIFFERNRQHRISRVRSRGAFNKFAYHARGPVRVARDLVLKMRRPEQVAADLDWLYGYKAPG
jgi:salicylate hydroxylase